MKQIKYVWEVIKAFFANEAHLAEAYRQEQIEMYNQWYEPEALKDSKVTILTPAVKRRALMYRSSKRKGTKK